MSDAVQKNGSPKVGRKRTHQQAEKSTATIQDVTKKPRSGDAPSTTIVCPYLDTINRKLLDFDFEKLCSTSLSNQNVYACLVCGKYYQGRGKNTYAYFHSLESDHHVFINLHTEKIYCLPDNYEVIDASLEDIKFNLHPKFTRDDVQKLNSNTTHKYALDGTDYLPGIIGLNNIKGTDWLNVVVQALSTVEPFREFFMIEGNYAHCKDALVHTYGELTRKMWNPRNFKGHVSPHELLQAVASASNKRFKIGTKSDPHKFVSWFLNTMHRALGGGRKRGSVVHHSFKGEVKITTQVPQLSAEALKKTAQGSISMAEIKQKMEIDDNGETVFKEQQKTSPFIFLSLKLPKQPLFKDTQDRSLIPQVALFDLLQKFDNLTEELLENGQRRKMTITKLPKYLILHYQRFQDNNWFTEKNQTLVNFPLINLDMAPYMEVPDVPAEEDLHGMSISQLKQYMKANKIQSTGCVEKGDLVDRILEHFDQKTSRTKYDLVANICHEGTPDKGTYKAYVLHKATKTWYEVQDLHLFTSESMPQLVAVSEAYIQIYELRDEVEDVPMVDETVKVI